MRRVGEDRASPDIRSLYARLALGHRGSLLASFPGSPWRPLHDNDELFIVIMWGESLEMRLAVTFVKSSNLRSTLFWANDVTNFIRQQDVSTMKVLVSSSHVHVTLLCNTIMNLITSCSGVQSYETRKSTERGEFEITSVLVTKPHV